MRLRNIIIAIFCFIQLTALAGTTTRDSIMHEGIWRYYFTYVPDIYDGSAQVPLLFNLHGYGSNAAQQNVYGDFKPIADVENFIMCLPEGTEDPGGSQFWNASFPAATVDDIGLIDALITKMSNQFAIKGSRIYSTGMSNGGYMSLTLACALSDKITAVASVTGTMTVTQAADCNPVRAVPMMQIHGTADPTVSYIGNLANLGIEEMVESWVTRNGCDMDPDTTAIPDIDMTDGCTAERFDYSGCDDNTEVVFYKIDGGAHTWPDAVITIGTTNRDFNGSEVIWEFFSKFEHPTYTGIKDRAIEKEALAFTVNNNSLAINDASLKGATITIYNMLGQQALQTTVQANMDISVLSSGMYVGVVASDEGMQSGQFVVR